MAILSGRCSCGNVTLNLDFPDEASHYSPRKCDCEFCCKHNAAWLSDSRGALTIHSDAPLNESKQGSMQACFLSCKHCANLVAVTCEINGILKGAVNARLVKNRESFQPDTVVSPRLLSPEDKAARWDQVWMNVKTDTHQ